MPPSVASYGCHAPEPAPAPVAVVRSFPQNSFAMQRCRASAAVQLLERLCRPTRGGPGAHVRGVPGQLSSTWNGTLLLLTGPACCWYMRV